jgi:hypothetical protein
MIIISTNTKLKMPHIHEVKHVYRYEEFWLEIQPCYGIAATSGKEVAGFSAKQIVQLVF